MLMALLCGFGVLTDLHQQKMHSQGGRGSGGQPLPQSLAGGFMVSSGKISCRRWVGF